MASRRAVPQTQNAPFLREVIEDPFEVWMSFERDRVSGKVGLRKRIVKRLDLPGKGGEMLVVAESRDGRLAALTYFDAGSSRYLDKSRTGMLLYRR